MYTNEPSVHEDRTELLPAYQHNGINSSTHVATTLFTQLSKRMREHPVDYFLNLSAFLKNKHKAQHVMESLNIHWIVSLSNAAIQLREIL